MGCYTPTSIGNINKFSTSNDTTIALTPTPSSKLCSSLNEKPQIPTGGCVYMNLETPFQTQIISSHECIGNSLKTIQTNFAFLTGMGLDFLYGSCTLFLNGMMCLSSQEDRSCITHYGAGCETGDEAELPLTLGGMWGQWYTLTNTTRDTIRSGNIEPLPLTSPLFLPTLQLNTNNENQGLLVIGYFKPPTSGNYTFYLESNEGSALWLGDLALGWSKRTTLNALVNNGLAGNFSGTLRRGETTRLNAGTYYPIRIAFQNKTGSGGINFTWEGPGIAETPDLTQHFYYKTNLPWTPESISDGDDFRSNLGYPRPSISESSYYLLKPPFLAYATKPYGPAGRCAYIDFYLKGDGLVTDKSPQIAVKIYEDPAGRMLPDIFDKTGCILQDTKYFSISCCNEWQSHRIVMPPLTNYNSHVWVEFERKTSSVPPEGSIGIGDFHYVVFPTDGYQRLLEVKEIDSEECIGNSLAIINNNFLKLKEFLKSAWCECCEGYEQTLPTFTFTPTPTPTLTVTPTPTPTPTAGSDKGIVEIQTGIQMQEIGGGQDIYQI